MSDQVTNPRPLDNLRKLFAQIKSYEGELAGPRSPLTDLVEGDMRDWFAAAELASNDPAEARDAFLVVLAVSTSTIIRALTANVEEALKEAKR